MRQIRVGLENLQPLYKYRVQQNYFSNSCNIIT